MKTPLRWCYRCSRSDISALVSCAESKSKCIRKISTESKRLSLSQRAAAVSSGSHRWFSDFRHDITVLPPMFLFSKIAKYCVGGHIQGEAFLESNENIRTIWLDQKPKNIFALYQHT